MPSYTHRLCFGPRPDHILACMVQINDCIAYVAREKKARKAGVLVVFVKFELLSTHHAR